MHLLQIIFKHSIAHLYSENEWSVDKSAIMGVAEGFSGVSMAGTGMYSVIMFRSVMCDGRRLSERAELVGYNCRYFC